MMNDLCAVPHLQNLLINKHIVDVGRKPEIKVNLKIREELKMGVEWWSGGEGWWGHGRSGGSSN